jgi:hypothetical protein
MRAFVFGQRRWLRAFTVVGSAIAVWGTWLGVGGTNLGSASGMAAGGLLAPSM